MSEHVFDQLAQLPILRSIAELTGRLIGINVVLHSIDGKQVFNMTPHIGHPDFCLAVQGSLRGHRMCLECDRSRCASVLRSGKAISYQCHAGLREFVIPIMVERNIQAFIQCGQVLDAPPTHEAWLATLHLLQANRMHEAKKLESLFMQLPHVEPRAQEDLMALLGLLGSYIAESQQIRTLLHQSGDTQVIYRARTFIWSHLTESISLDAVARAAFTSKRNLTRIFRSVEGQTVVEYIHAQRIQQACRLLRETDVSCGQIAFESGFGSLQQFNRVFRKSMGQPPSHWRRMQKIDKK